MSLFNLPVSHNIPRAPYLLTNLSVRESTEKINGLLQTVATEHPDITTIYHADANQEFPVWHVKHSDDTMVLKTYVCYDPSGSSTTVEASIVGGFRNDALDYVFYKLREEFGAVGGNLFPPPPTEESFSHETPSGRFSGESFNSYAHSSLRNCPKAASDIQTAKLLKTMGNFGNVVAAKQTKDLSIPTFYRRVMCLDTETTGLLPKKKYGESFPPDSAYPHITQLSWIIYNVSTNKIEEVANEYVRVSDAVEISDESSKVSGITRDLLKETGVNLVPLLIKFYSAYMKCDCIVAHNIHFDGEVIRKEMWRNRGEFSAILKNPERANQMTGVFTRKFNAAYHIDMFCTMMNTIDLCALSVSPPTETMTPPPTPDDALAKPAIVRCKFPKLKELYCKLFDPATQPVDLHNSIVDVLVCLRCFLKVRGATEMTEEYFQELVSKYSRH